MHLENLKQGDIVHIGQHTFRFLWFYGKGIDLQPIDNINVFHVPLSRFADIRVGPAGE